ncbi:MAG: CHAT domain-containing protein, partial [candidate division Zixibacteria bacterium]|nr:CHAT domain-containing protein [candidate division Zixibacteria bacterium]
SFRTSQDRRDVRCERIASLLPDNSILVEYVSYERHIGPGDSTRSRYLIVVVDNQGARDIVDIGPAENIDVLVDRYRHHLLDVSTHARGPSVVDQAQYETISRELYRAVLKPVEKWLVDRDLVFVAPDGGLTLVSFAGLQDEEGKYLVEKYPVHYLASGRDLIRSMDVPPASTGLLAMGDPDYDATAEARLSGLRETPDVPVLPQNTPRPDSPQGDLRSGCGRLDEITVKPLPATRYEIEKVVESWRASSPEPVVVCLGARAGEEALKQKAPGSRAIHLATHGYFLRGDCGTLFPQSDHTLDYGFVGENPLLMSGLLLAGANLHGRGADSIGAEDGILSAEEVTALNLDGTELVVLSACETGLGRVTAGEGVYGLRRAFQLAGARTVVSALWPVSDEATADLMSGLYDRGSESLPQTIRAMQRQAIRELRSAGKLDHPFSWGAFVAIGDWR